MYLIDSSAWIEFLRATGSRAHVEVRTLLRDRPDSVATTEPVVMELLAGAPDDRALRRLQTLTTGLRLVSVDAVVDYRDAAMVYRSIRRSGYTIRSILDCLIASVATRAGATLLHRDRDYDVLAEALPDLRVRSLL